MDIKYIDVSIEESFCAIQKDPSNVKLYTENNVDMFVEASELYNYMKINNTDMITALDTIAESNDISADDISIILPYLESLYDNEDSGYEDFIQEALTNNCAKYNTEILSEGAAKEVSSAILEFIKSKIPSIKFDRIIIVRNTEGSGYRLRIEFVINGKKMNAEDMVKNGTIKKKDYDSIEKFVSKQMGMDADINNLQSARYMPKRLVIDNK